MVDQEPINTSRERLQPPTPADERESVAKKDLRSRLAATRAELLNRSQTLMSLGENTYTGQSHGYYGPDNDVRGLSEFPTISAAVDFVNDRLTAVSSHESNLPPIQFMKQSVQALANYKYLSDRIARALPNYQQAYQTYTDELAAIDGKITELRRNPKNRLFPKGMKAELTEKEQLEHTLAVVRDNLAEGQQYRDRLLVNRLIFQILRDRNLLMASDQAQAEIAAIGQAYVNLKEEILRDGTITQEVREAFAQDEMEPRIKEYGKQRLINAPSAGDLRYHLQTLLQLGRSGNKEKYIEYCEKLKATPGFPTDYFQELLEEEDEKMVTTFIDHIVAHDINAIKDSIIGSFAGGSSIRRDIEDILAKVVASPGRYRLETSHAFAEIEALDFFKNNQNFSLMKMWSALKTSPLAQSLFAEEIKQKDEEIYSLALNNSLSDDTGFFIAGLGYYPTPDSIRNLVLLACSDSHRRVTDQASETLDRMARRKDLRQVLEAAVRKYPDLDGIVPVLENWTYIHAHQNQDLTPIASDLALTIFEDPDSDPKLRNLAQKTIFTQLLLEKVLQRGWLTEEEAVLLIGVESEEFKDRLERNSKLASGRIYDLKRYIREACLDVDFDNPSDNGLASLKRIAKFLSVTHQEINNPQALGYLFALKVMSSVAKTENLTDAQTNLMLSAYKTYPALVTDEKQREKFIHYFFQFSTPEGFMFFGQFYEKYKNVQDYADILFEELKADRITKELILAIPDQARLLMDEKYKGIASYIFTFSDILIRDTSDLRFLNTFVGMHGKKADSLIRGYRECLEAGVITNENRQILLEFTQKFRVLSPEIVRAYLTAKEGGYEEVLLAELRSIAEKLTGGGVITEKERSKPYFIDLLKHVYPSNSGGDTITNSKNCQDRNQDLAEFSIRPRYEVDLLSASEIRVKEGQVVNTKVIESLKDKILEIGRSFTAVGLGSEQMKAALLYQVDIAIASAKAKGRLQNIDTAQLTSLEDRLFVLLVEATYGDQAVDFKQLKSLLIAYEFTDQDFRVYVEGTTDRVIRASNQDYALLCELNAFFADRIKEVNRKLVQSAWNNPAIVSSTESYFKKISQQTVTSTKRQEIGKLQLDKLGLSDSFVGQMGRLLRDRTGRTYSPDQIKRIIQRYESLAGGLVDQRMVNRERMAEQKQQIVGKGKTREELTQAFYGQLRTQREKTLEAARKISGEEYDLREIHLGEINLQQLIEAENDIRTGEYHPDQFAAYTAQRFLNLFADEVVASQKELDKFESTTGKEREVLYGYITKTKESANARAVGGVCVASDNPGRYRPENQWDMPNYLQLVLQDPETYQCQGVVLLHHFTDENGKKILVASLNPSSTYLYTVDEKALFNGLMTALEQFCQDNNFDMIAVSQNRAIRTNRTNGIFEQAMKERIKEVNKGYRFLRPQTFSYSPGYQIQDMDIIWENTQLKK